jgi:pimeloyl-ACP methyl ester carboxylesterase
VVAFDARGYGQSSWSPSKNYSVDASIDDVIALLDHLGWKQAVFMGHSRGGAFALVAGSRFPERTAGVILVDRPLHSPIGHPSPDGRPAVGNKPRVYSTVRAAIEDMSRDERAPIGSPARARLDDILEPVEGGFVLRNRDPDHNNTIPVGAVDWSPRFVVDDLWLELQRVRSPVLIVYARRSDRYPPSSLDRLKSQFPSIPVVGVDSGHDVAVGAPAELIAYVERFLADRINAVQG